MSTAAIPAREEGRYGMATAQRLYVYVVMLVTMFTLAGGLTALVRVTITEAWPGRTLFGDPAREIALGLALVLVAAPVWLLHWWIASKSVARQPSEDGRFLRQGYLNLVAFVAILVTAFSSLSVLDDLMSFGPGAIEADALAAAVVWGGVWTAHWRWSRASWTPDHLGRSLHRWYLYVIGAAGLIMFASGIGNLVLGLLRPAYDAVFGDLLLRQGVWNAATREGLRLMAVGGLLWFAHWRIGAAGDVGSILRNVYVTLAAVAAVLTAVGAAIAITWSVVRLALGNVPQTVASQLDVLPGALAALAAAGAVWLYFAPVVLFPRRAVDPFDAKPESAWAYRYAVQAAGLLLLAAAAVVAISLLTALVVPDARVIFAGADWWREPLSFLIPAVLVGGLLWGYYERRLMPADVQAAGEVEAAHLPQDRVRRLYLFLVTGAATVASVGAASSLLFIFLFDLLAGNLSGATLESGKWALGIMLTGIGIAAYHWRRIRLEGAMAVGDLMPARRKRVVMVAPSGAEAARARIEQALGREIEWREDLSWESSGEAPAPEDDLSTLADRIEAAPGRVILLLPGPEGIRLVSHD